MEINDELRELILVGRIGARAQEEGDRAGDDHAARSGLIKVALGQTTMEEVLRETVL